MSHEITREKIKAALTKEEYGQFQDMLTTMAKDAIRWRE